MTGKLLKSYFDSIIPLDLDVWNNFATLGHVKHFSKGATLKSSDTTEKYFNFILEGSGGNLLWNKNNFVCTDISMKEQPLSDYVSFMTQHPSSIEVRVFEDSTVFQIHYDDFQKIFQKGNYGEQVTRLALESAYKEKEQQQIDLLTKTAKLRYLEMIKRDRRFEEVPLNYMASYLGITPQSLSRIRSQKI